MNTIALLFARGGSKRLPRKHLLNIGDVPVIGHAIRYALKATPEVYVSTDCPEISAVSESFGATVIQRPASLAADNSPLTAALFHAVDQLRAHAWKTLVALEGGTIILRPGIIEDCVAALHAQQADYTTTIFRCSDKHPDWAVARDAAGFVRPLGKVNANSQENRPLWHLNGSVEILTRAGLERADRSARQMLECGLQAIGIEIRESDLIHIDHIDDLNYARWRLTVRDEAERPSGSGRP